VEDSGAYKVEKISKSRTIAIDMMYETIKRHHVKALIEPDVTDARAALHRREECDGVHLSFTAWLIKCISRAAAEYPEVHALRRGKRVYVFEDIDISIMIEVKDGDETVPLPYVVRRTDLKSVEDISREIDVFKTSRQSGGDMVLGDKESSSWVEFYLHMPGFLRRLVWRALVRMPLTLKRFGGTIIVTSVGMFGKTGGWAIAFGLQSLAFDIGGIARKPGVTAQGTVPREFLDMTVLIDHDVIDGAPAARFIARLVELIETADGL
jgi:pyruvate/2-oxoglutarate dehydrogenase complex dihydrolipoamide acyltransferase (E2) component